LVAFTDRRVQKNYFDVSKKANLPVPVGFLTARRRQDRLRTRSPAHYESSVHVDAEGIDLIAAFVLSRRRTPPGSAIWRFVSEPASVYMTPPLGSRPGSSSVTMAFSRLRALAAAVLIGFGVSSCGYNNIPTLEEAAKAKWAEVENQYQRRSDLIPNLVQTVQGYAKQEKDVLVAVTEARAKATSIHVDANDLTDPAKVKQLQDAQNALSGALGRLLAVSENYPDLKSNQNFLALQSQLEGTENRISVARKDYIAAVQEYNTALRTFPGVIWASTAFRGNKPMAEFTATDEAQTVPKVKF
jgi:LemA protein